MRSDKIHASITLEPMQVQDPLGCECEWCGRPLERGERVWFAENRYADALGCSKACARGVVFAATHRLS